MDSPQLSHIPTELWSNVASFLPLAPSLTLRHVSLAHAEAVRHSWEEHGLPIKRSVDLCPSEDNRPPPPSLYSCIHKLVLANWNGLAEQQGEIGTPAYLANALQSLHNVRRLVCHLKSPPHLAVLCEHMENGLFPKLESLAIQHSTRPIGVASFREQFPLVLKGLRGRTQLQSLELQFCDLQDEDCLALGEILPTLKKLRKIALYRCLRTTNPASLKALFDALSQLPLLQEFSSTMNYSIEEGLRRAIQEQGGLKVGGFPVSDSQTDKWDILAGLWQCGPRLTSLCLRSSFQGGSESDARLWAFHCLKRLPNLQILDLDATDSTSYDASVLGESLQHMPQLRRLDLSRNIELFSSYPGVYAMSAAFATLHHIEEINLSFVEMVPEKILILARNLGRSCKSLRIEGSGLWLKNPELWGTLDSEMRREAPHIRIWHMQGN